MSDYYFADTYALVEILRGKGSYRAYAASVLYTTDFNLLELAYPLVRDFGRDTALNVLQKIRNVAVVVATDDSDFARAAEMRIAARKSKKNLSLIDCLGYVVAQRMGVPFLTGDREFRDLPDVEFVR